MKIALLANLKQNAPTWPGMSPDQWDHLDSWETIDAISIALEKAGHHVIFLEGDETLYNNLEAVKPDICFNVCQGHFGSSQQAQVPAILEMLRIPYTGSHVLTLALDKLMTRQLLAYHKLPAPPFQLFEQVDEPLGANLQFPLLVSPSRKRTGLGIGPESIVRSEDQLRNQLRHIFERYNQPALVEQFIEGRQITIGIVGNLAAEDRTAPRLFQGLHFFPPLEINLAAYSPSQDPAPLRVNPVQGLDYRCPAPLTKSQVEDLNWLSGMTFQAVGCLDVARVDFRLDANDKAYIVDVNLLPGLNPVHSYLCLQAAADGWRYEKLINHILDEAIARHQLKIRLGRNNFMGRFADEMRPSLNPA